MKSQKGRTKNNVLVTSQKAIKARGKNYTVTHNHSCTAFTLAKCSSDHWSNKYVIGQLQRSSPGTLDVAFGPY